MTESLDGVRPTPWQLADRDIRGASAADMLNELDRLGYVIVHPDDIPEVGASPYAGPSVPLIAWEQGWKDCRESITSHPA